MLDSYTSYFKVVTQLLISREFSHNLALLSRLNILIRRKVVRNKVYSVLVEYLVSIHARQILYCHRTGNIVCEHGIELSLDELSSFYMIEAGVCGQDLLGHRHSHMNFLLISEL